MPTSCHPRALAWFRQQVPRIESTDGLLHAAMAIAMHALPDTDPAAVDQSLAKLAERVRQGAPSGKIEALLAHLHDVLFVAEKLEGNTDRYYLADNSYLPRVLETRRGLPILLALIYKVVGSRAGLQIDGINSPGHFLVRVLGDDGWMIVDPFFHGQVLTRDETFDRLERVSGRPVPRDDRYLPVATHAEWISRILSNLQSLFAAEGRQGDLAAMSELQHELGDTLGA